MLAAVITRTGGPEVLELREVPDPVPGPWEVLVRVEASALNRADLLQRRGLYPAPHGVPSDIPGLELAGTVVGRGAQVTRLAVGDRVMAIVGGGACAELCVVHEREAIRVPDGLASTAAAAVPEAFVTAFDAAILQGGLGSGQWLVVNAIGSGVGTAALQIAHAIGARVVGSSRTRGKLEAARALGLDVPVLGETADLVPAALEATGGRGAAVAVDLVGGPGLAALLGCLRPKGTAVLVGLMGGAKADLNLGLVLQRRLTIKGTVLRSRPVEEKIAVARAFEDRVAPLFGGPNPRIRPVVDRVLPLAAIADAHSAMEANANFGKIVLEH